MSILAFQPDAERYYSEGYWRSGDLWGEFVRSAELDPGKTALHVGARSISYGELRRAAVALSTRLAESGVAAGDVVLLLGRNSIEAAVALLACFHRGAVAAPLPPMFGTAQLSALAAQAQRSRADRASAARPRSRSARRCAARCELVHGAAPGRRRGR